MDMQMMVVGAALPVTIRYAYPRMVSGNGSFLGKDFDAYGNASIFAMATCGLGLMAGLGFGSQRGYDLAAGSAIGFGLVQASMFVK